MKEALQIDHLSHYRGRRRFTARVAPVMAWAGVLGVIMLSAAYADEKPAAASKWENNMKTFAEQDRAHPVAPGGILFVGSSTIRMWDLPKCFPGSEALNRGFGGSEVSDVIEFADRIVFPYAPRLIVFYSGDNDIAHGKTADQVFADFETLLKKVHEKLPKTKFVALSIKPSAARWNLWPQMKEVNRRVQALAETDPLLTYVDAAAATLDAEGNPRKDLLLEDGLHLNAKGYEIWSALVKPQLTPAP